MWGVAWHRVWKQTDLNFVLPSHRLKWKLHFVGPLNFFFLRVSVRISDFTSYDMCSFLTLWCSYINIAWHILSVCTSAINMWMIWWIRRLPVLWEKHMVDTRLYQKTSLVPLIHVNYHFEVWLLLLYHLPHSDSNRMRFNMKALSKKAKCSCGSALSNASKKMRPFRKLDVFLTVCSLPWESARCNVFLRSVDEIWRRWWWCGIISSGMIWCLLK